MKRRIKSHVLLIVISFAMVFLIVLIIGLIHLFRYLSLDKSAEFAGNTMHWKGKSYIEVSGRYNEGDTIAKTTDGEWKISEVEGDKEHNFIVVRSFLDQYLYVNEEYEIPTNGEITSVYVDYKKIVDSEFCNAVKQVIKDSGETFEYETDNIYSNTEDIYLCYENCAVGTEFAGNIGVINDRWVYIDPQQETYAVNEDGSSKSVTITCTIIDEKYTEILQKNSYFKALMNELQDSDSEWNVSKLNISESNISKVNSFFQELETLIYSQSEDKDAKEIEPIEDADFVVTDGVNSIVLDSYYDDFTTNEMEEEVEEAERHNYESQLFSGEYYYEIYYHRFADFDLYTSNVYYDLKGDDIDTYYIYRISLQNSNYRTARGIAIGSDVSDIYSAYRKDEIIQEDNDILAIRFDNKKIYFYMDENNKVTYMELLIYVDENSN